MKVGKLYGLEETVFGEEAVAAAAGGGSLTTSDASLARNSCIFAQASSTDTDTDDEDESLFLKKPFFFPLPSAEDASVMEGASTAHASSASDVPHSISGVSDAVLELMMIDDQ